MSDIMKYKYCDHKYGTLAVTLVPPQYSVTQSATTQTLLPALLFYLFLNICFANPNNNGVMYFIKVSKNIPLHFYLFMEFIDQNCKNF